MLKAGFAFQVRSFGSLQKLGILFAPMIRVPKRTSLQNTFRYGLLLKGCCLGDHLQIIGTLRVQPIYKYSLLV